MKGEMGVDWYQKESGEVVDELGSSVKGLSAQEAQNRLKKYGPNELEEKKKKTAFMMLMDQFTDFMIIVLMAAAVVAGVAGKPTDAVAIIAIVILNAIIGFVQEYRADKAMAALKKMAASASTVMRDGRPVDLPSSEIVPGDIVLLEAGQVIPADMRLLETANLKVEEAALTGESVPVGKHTERLGDEHLPTGDQVNMAYQGTIATYGRGRGVVVATGMQTEIGKIAAMLQAEKGLKTPLQKRLAVFGKKLAIAILIICAIVFAKGLLRGEPVLLMFLTAISLAVAAIPEALPAVITIALAIGAKKMVKKNALIRKLPAVETLGSVTYICSDKTGTLTLNQMTVEEIFVEGEIMGSAGFQVSKDVQSPSHLLMTALALSNDARPGTEDRIIGDPTEVALYSIAKNKGFDKDKLDSKFPRVAEIPFDSERKCMTTIHKWTDGYVSFTKGAIDVLIEKSKDILTSDGPRALKAADIYGANERMAADGLRVLGVAMRNWDRLPDDISFENIEADLTILGLTGMMDPPRDEAKDAVAVCQRAGIKPVMITGDHPLTARVIAQRLGIVDDDSTAVLSGSELEQLSLEEFEERVEQIKVYARVAPEQKLKIVTALQDKGQFVAMTGDGVNDAPALKRADIGVAMGITGTDVSKEASSMILLDDNFATIVTAVKEGRRIYDNILKFIKYSMTSNAGTLWAIVMAPFFGLPLPLVPIQILWMNFLTDSLPGLALTAEPVEKNAMNRPPRPPDEGIFARGRGFFIIRFGLVIGISALLFQAFALKEGLPWQTMIFTALVIGRMGVVMGLRSEHDSLFTIGVFSNKPLLGAVLLTFVLQMATVYVPFLNPVFNTVPLTPYEFALTLALSAVVFVAIEMEKLWVRIRRRTF
jgi:Ca2+-transporting ATPase